jgi:hypothetical protein
MKTINLKGILETLSDLELKHVVGGEDTSAESPEGDSGCGSKSQCSGPCPNISGTCVWVATENKCMCGSGGLG